MATLSHPGKAMRHPALLVVSIIASAVLWVLFVATSSPHEMMVGVFCVGATVVFTVFVCDSAGLEMTLRPNDMVQGWRIPWYIVSRVAEITWIFFKDLLHIDPAKNLYRVCGFDSSKSDPVRIARTVMAVAYTTTAPNFIVIGIDPSQSRMLFHQIAASSISPMTKALGAKG